MWDARLTYPHGRTKDWRGWNVSLPCLCFVYSQTERVEHGALNNRNNTTSCYKAGNGDGQKHQVGRMTEQPWIGLQVVVH